MDKFCPKSTKKTVHIKTINDSNYRFLMHGKGEKMKKSVRKKGWFKRISAVIMAVALILSGLYIPDGLFSVTAKAAEKLSATWSPTNSTLTDASGVDKTTSDGGVVNGKLTNEEGNIINITGEGQFRVRNSGGNCDFLVNAKTVMELPVVSGAKRCTVTLVSYDDITIGDSIVVSGMSNVEIKNTTGKGNWDTYTITGDVDKKQNSISLTLGGQKYFKSVAIESSTSYAVTSALFSEGVSEAVWDYTGIVAAGNSSSSIQKVTGTYTNKSGDVMYLHQESLSLRQHLISLEFRLIKALRWFFQLRGIRL